MTGGTSQNNDSMIHPCKHGEFDESVFETFCTKFRCTCAGSKGCRDFEVRAAQRGRP